MPNTLRAASPSRLVRFFLTAIFMASGVLGITAASADENRKPIRGLIFHASFDGVSDVDLFAADGDGWAYTADSPAMKVVTQGLTIPEVSIAKNAGRLGDALRFSAKTSKVLCYKAEVNGLKPTENWSGTVSIWLKLDPDRDLPEGFCDPLLITAKKWNDAAFFVDFNKDLPRDLRLGVFSDHSVWNPKSINWEDFPVHQRPMVTVKRPPFSSDKWTHVAFTFANVNSTSDQPSIAKLYLDGKLQGSIKRPIRFTWPKPEDPTVGNMNSKAMIMLGINYIGDMDELALFNRALTDDEIKQVYLHPERL